MDPTYLVEPICLKVTAADFPGTATVWIATAPRAGIEPVNEPLETVILMHKRQKKNSTAVSQTWSRTLYRYTFQANLSR